MTRMEQGLRYIEREIRFMVKDQFGNPTYAKFADRVVQDACGISNFCSTVLSSKRPLTAILRAVRGPRGDIIMRFFNASLHDARIEMVMVLAEATKLRIHSNKSSREAHEYLLKLYKKAIKRTIRLITGSKNKESYKSLYRSLRSYASMDDLDYDEDDEDEDDAYFNASEFGDSDYADACLDAYRDGKNPIDIEVRSPRKSQMPNISLMGNEEILREISEIQSRIGRELTDRELDMLLCGDDEDDEPLGYHGREETIPESAMDKIVDAIYSRLVKKLGISNDAEDESLEEYISRQTPEETPTPQVLEPKGVAASSAIPENPSLERLVGIHNQLKAGSSTSTNNKSIVEVADEESSDDDENSCLPPNDTLGGEYTEQNAKKHANVEEENSPQIQHALLASDIIRDFDLQNSDLSEEFKSRIINFFSELDDKDIGTDVILMPSNEKDKLFRLHIRLRVSYLDIDTINVTHLNIIAVAHLKALAERLGISDDLIELDMKIIDCEESYAEDLELLNTGEKGFSPWGVHDIYAATCAVTMYIYRQLNQNIGVRFINNPNTNKLILSFISKDADNLPDDFIEFFDNELIGENILDEVFNSFEIEYEREYHFADEISNEDFFKEIQEVTNIEYSIDFVSDAQVAIDDYMTDTINIHGETTSKIDTSISKNSLIVDIIYTIETVKPLAEDVRKEFEEYIRNRGEISFRLEEVLRAVSSNIEVVPYFKYLILTTDDQDSTDDTTKSSNFGI